MVVSGELNPAPKIFRETCRIDWNQPVKHIYDFIRGLSPYPAAWTELNLPDCQTISVKVFESEKEVSPHSLVPGTIVTDNKTYLKVAATDGFVRLKTIQFPGKKRLSTSELLRGYNFSDGATF